MIDTENKKKVSTCRGMLQKVQYIFTIFLAWSIKSLTLIEDEIETYFQINPILKLNVITT